MNKTKNAIFEVAIKEFSMNGYNKTTMDSIAEKAGVAKGTLYYHFNSKEEIFNYIMEEGMSRLSYRVEEAVKGQKNFYSKFKILCKVQLMMVYENKEFFKVIMSQLWGQESRQLELRKALKDYFSQLEGYIKEAIAEKAIRGGNAALMAYSLFGTICAAAIYELINNSMEIDAVVDNLMDYILKGVDCENVYS
ncbi:TetR/AcrR family transcriptional regulator [Clostridium sp. 19966]|uniref:TetR/AcrR family transcriptional regulator n=1 Tax=Clostridium sp. 19966 TaxID=2768166 RepID=UPI0028DD48F7|nr:TetR/AcrR family transcriptional regulator [Clostridium sp. 19966]MDT8718592.1 TetR/AcrR family transcriptional regulator [Clostridium sp. 19966]